MSIYGKEDDAKIQKDLDPYTGLLVTFFTKFKLFLIDYIDEKNKVPAV